MICRIDVEASIVLIGDYEFEGLPSTGHLDSDMCCQYSNLDGNPASHILCIYSFALPMKCYGYATNHYG